MDQAESWKEVRVLRQATESSKVTRTAPAWWMSIVALAPFAFAACHQGGRPGHVLDEAARVRYPLTQLKAADEDYFHDMDGGLPLTKPEIEGRNTWIVWTGGNDRFWDAISVNSVGSFDLLKVVSSHGSNYNRSNRWREQGLVNEPCFTQ